jgi:methyl-accepting chemotaxis protein
VGILNLFGGKRSKDNNGKSELDIYDSESNPDVMFDFAEISARSEQYFKNHSVFAKISNFVSIFNNLIENMFSAANISAKFTFYTKNIVNSVSESNKNIESITTAMSESVKAIDSINNNVTYFAQFIDQTHTLSKEISQTANKMTESTNQTKLVIDENVKYIDTLGNEFDKIRSITDAVNNIAGMINILSLNASIEAARAGEHGKSFAAVAEEIKKLAVQTQNQSKNIDKELNSILGSFTGLNERNQTIKKKITENVGYIENIVNSFVDLDGKISQTDSMINSIATNIEEQSGTMKKISNTIECFSDSLKKMGSDVNKINQESGCLINKFNASLNDTIKKTNTGSCIENAISLLMQSLREIIELIEASIKRGAILSSDIWDRDYIPVHGTNPQRHKTKFTDFFKTHIQPIEDNYLKKADNFRYFVMIDNNGYIPAHNSIYDKPSTGVYDHDIGNRSMRIFNDPFNLSIARNTDGLIIQTYARDTGEVMTDISVSVFMEEKHWGCIRIGVLM